MESKITYKKTVNNLTEIDNITKLDLTINDFKDDVYVGVDKFLLKGAISKVTAARIARDLGLHSDTVERWYWDKNRALSVASLKYICNLTKTNPSIFKVKWIGGRGNPKNRLIPFINSDLAYFLGLVVGDGHLYDNRIVISSDKELIKGVISPFCKKTFDIKIITRKIDTWYITEINSRPLVWFLRDIFKIPIGRKGHIIKIPEIIRKNNQLTPPFLQGLYDSDGSIGKKGAVSFCTISQDLRDDVTEILIKLGFNINIWIDKRSKNLVYHIRFANKKSVKLFKEKIGFKHPFKISRLRALY